MSLLGALNLGSTSLAAQQVGLQVTGNNIANAGTPGYTRQVARISESTPQVLGNGIYVGTGANLDSIERQVSAALDESLRDANSKQSSSGSLNDMLGRIETVFGTLSDNDLSARLGEFFGSFSTLANNPQDAAQRAVVIQTGVSLAGYITDLRSNLLGVREDAQTQIRQLVQQADALAKRVAELNGQIVRAEAGGGTANTLRDQRDVALSDLSTIMDIRVIEQPDGQVNVLSGSTPLVMGTATPGLAAVAETDPTGRLAVTNVVLANTGEALSVGSGKLAGLLAARDTHIDGAVNTLDEFAASLINTVNMLHTQGQGLSGFSDVTGATAVLDQTAPLNSALSVTGLPAAPVNGTFNLHVKDLTTGLITTRQIKVNLLSTGVPTTLASLATSITSGNIIASVDVGGHLNILSNNPNVTFTFSDDTSGALSALGINTFFTGHDASDIGVNRTIITSPDKLAAGRDNIAGSNKNAKDLALAYVAADGAPGGMSLKDYYNNYVGNLAAQARAAADDAKTQSVVHDALFAQREAYSGVSMDEEAINLTKYQRAFQGTARYISVVDDMMQTVLGLIG